jgi:hypothetical protein
MNQKKSRFLVRGIRPNTACGDIGHMTVDQLRLRSIGDVMDGRCPACGRIHLSDEDIAELEETKIVDSERYKTIQKEAEAS